MTSSSRGRSVPKSYAELHAHSYFSFLDGVCSPAEMVAEASRLELGGLALIDHDGFTALFSSPKLPDRPDCQRSSAPN